MSKDLHGTLVNIVDSKKPKKSSLNKIVHSSTADLPSLSGDEEEIVNGMEYWRIMTSNHSYIREIWG